MTRSERLRSMRRHRRKLVVAFTTILLVASGGGLYLATSSGAATNYGTVCPIDDGAAVIADGAAVGCTLFGPTPATPTVAGDAKSVEVGVRFTVSAPGLIRGIRFYKGAGNVTPTGTNHTVTLWNADNGVAISSHTLTNETASGWQQGDFELPVPQPGCVDALGTSGCGNTDLVYPGVNYIASVYDPSGHYANMIPTLGATLTNGPLTAPGSTSTAGNGVYVYSTAGAGKTFPNQTYLANNYSVDVVFQAANCVSGTTGADISLCPNLQTTTTLATTTTAPPTTTTTLPHPTVYDPKTDGPIPPKTCFLASQGIVECQDYLPLSDPAAVPPSPTPPPAPKTTTTTSTTVPTTSTTSATMPGAPSSTPPST